CKTGLTLFSSSSVSSKLAGAGLDWYQKSDGCSCVVSPVSSGARTSSRTFLSPEPREPPVTRAPRASLAAARYTIVRGGAFVGLGAFFGCANTLEQRNNVARSRLKFRGRFFICLVGFYSILFSNTGINANCSAGHFQANRIARQALDCQLT